jgi:hypothetical protein
MILKSGSNLSLVRTWKMFKLITHQTTQIWNNRNPNIDEKDIEAELVKDFCDNFKLD